MDVTPSVADALAAHGLPPNLGVIVCNDVLHRERPVLLVVHDEDGDWQFLCGADHARDSSSAASLCCIADVVETDPTLAEILGLAENEMASRSWRDDPWRRSRP